MISFFRRFMNSWPALALLGLVLVAFAVTGVGDPFGSRGAPTGSVARVGETTLTEADLLKAFDRAMRAARQQNPKLTQSEVARQGGVSAIADQLIGTTALDQFGRRAGLHASDRAIGGVIAGIAAFQQGGKFDEATYRRVIQQNGVSDRELRDSIRGDLVRQQLLTPVGAAVGMPRTMAESYAHLLVDTRKGGVTLVPLAAVAPATDAEITDYYNKNKAKFIVPERRAFRHAAIDRAAIAAAIKVSDADIAAAYARDPAKYGAAATRRLQQVVVPDEAKAKAVAAAAASEDFAAVAQRLAGFGAADVELGDQDQAGFAKATSPAVATAAFALPAGGITAPIRTDFGWHVVRVASIGGAGKTLAEARPAIEAELRRRATDTAVADLVARIEDGVDAGKSFADLARENGLTIVTEPAMTAEGAVDNSAAAVDPARAALAAKAFRHEPGDGAAVEDLGEGRLVAIETMQVLRAAPAPLAEVRAVVAASAARDKALAAARGTAEAIVAETRKSGDFAAAVAKRGLAAPQPLAGSRLQVAGNPNVSEVVRIFLQTPAGTVRVVPSPQGWVLIHVAAIVPGDLTAESEVVEGSRRELAAALPAEFGEVLARAAARDVGVNRNEKTITAVTRRLSGLDSGTP